MCGRAFDEYAVNYDGWFLDNLSVLESEVRLLAKAIGDAGRALSVGCGSGLFEMLLRQDHGIEIAAGVEPAKAMAEIARKRGLDVRDARAESLPFPDGDFDTVVMNGTPSYIADFEAAAREAWRVLRPGGRAVVLDVPKESSYGLLYRLASEVGTWDHPALEGVAPEVPYPIEFAAEANWRTTREKREILASAGFTGFEHFQTLTRHPLYSNDGAEEPVPGHDRGDYVAIVAGKTA